VACPSVNPDGEGRTIEHKGEARIIDLREHLLEPWADSIEIHEAAPGRPNLIARFDGEDSTRHYALEAHTDTVGIDGMTTEPVVPKVRDGRLYGRGACDTKGPMTAMLLALMQAKAGLGKFPATWYFLATCGEELGGLGANALVGQGFRCDGIVVGEPTGLLPVHANKGAVRYHIELHGRAGHSAYPEHGVNAIHAAARLINELERSVPNLSAPLSPCPTGPLTLSAGTIRGGDQVNRIPDKVEINIDIRIPPTCAMDRIEALMEATCSHIRELVPDLEIQITQTQSYPPFALGTNAPFRTMANLLDPEPNFPHRAVRYATNAGFYASARIPCVVYGPGSIALEAVRHAKDRLLEGILTTV